MVNGMGSGAVFRRWECSDFRRSYRTAGQQTIFITLSACPLLIGEGLAQCRGVFSVLALTPGC